MTVYLKFIGKRTAAALGILLVLTAVIFSLQDLAPGDPAAAYLGANASPSALAQARRALGLDRPFVVRYSSFLGNILHGQLGESYRTRRPVAADIREYLPSTVELVAVALIFAIVLAVLFAASGLLRWRGGGLLRGTLLLLAAAPTFLLGIVGIALFFSKLHWLPLSGAGPADPGPTGFLLVDTLLHGQIDAFGQACRHILLPALVLSLVPAVSIGRILHSSFETTMQSDYVRTAEAKGLAPMRVLAKHVFRNSVGPALSMTGLQLGFMFGGTVIVESVFSWPGIGNYMAQSLQADDYPAITGTALVLGVVYVVVNAAVDMLQALADPRIAL
jgi:peptide/nickel transport system permease protein